MAFNKNNPLYQVIFEPFLWLWIFSFQSCTFILIETETINLNEVSFKLFIPNKTKNNVIRYLYKKKRIKVLEAMKIQVSSKVVTEEED